MQGCLVFILVAFSWLVVCAVTGAVLGGDEATGMVMGSLVFFGISFAVFKNSFEEAKKNLENQAKAGLSIAKLLENLPAFTATDSFRTDNKSAFIAVDEKRRKIALGGIEPISGSISHRVIQIKEILGVEITENGKGLLSSSATKNSLGMAAVGGLLFGGAGAIVGAVSGSNTKAKITEVSLKIAIDDIKTPYAGINFISETLDEQSDKHRQILATADKWFGIVNILIEREKKSPLQVEVECDETILLTDAVLCDEIILEQDVMPEEIPEKEQPVNICKKCGYHRTESDDAWSEAECPKCGVIYAKIKPRIVSCHK